MKFNCSKYIALAFLCVISTHAYTQGSDPIIQGTTFSNPSPIASQWANRGIELFEQGDNEKAIEYLTEAWKLSPDKTNVFSKNLSVAYNNYANDLYASGKVAHALQSLRRSLFYDPGNKSARTNIDVLYSNEGKTTDNFDFRLGNAHKLRSDGYLEEAVAEYTEALELQSSKEKSSKTKLELAQVYQVLHIKYLKSPVKQMLFQRMVLLIKDLTEEIPNDERPHILLGSAYLGIDRLSESIQSFENALKLKPNSPKAKVGLVKAWEKVINVAPNEPNNLIGYGSALIRSGDETKGQAYLEKAKNIDPNTVTEIEDILSSSRQFNKDNKAYRLAEKALSAQKNGKLKTAISLYQKALADLPPSPETSDIHYNLAIAYKQDNRLGLAIKENQKALRINANNQKAKTLAQELKQLKTDTIYDLQKRAIAQQSANNLPEAINLYEQAIKVDPNNAGLYFNLGTAYQEYGNIQEAYNQYKKASEIDPYNEEYKNAELSLERAINQGYTEIAKSRQLVQEAVDLQNEGKLTEAIDVYLEAIKNDSRNAQAHFNLGTAYHVLGREDQAVRSYELAYELDSKLYPEAQYFIGTLTELKNKTKALRAYRLYLELAPNGEYAANAKENIKDLNL